MLGFLYQSDKNQPDFLADFFLFWADFWFCQPTNVRFLKKLIFTPFRPSGIHQTRKFFDFCVLLFHFPWIACIFKGKKSHPFVYVKIYIYFFTFFSWLGFYLGQSLGEGRPGEIKKILRRKKNNVQFVNGFSLFNFSFQ